MALKVEARPLSAFKPDPHQPRHQYDQSELERLAESMKTLGQLQPVGAKPDGTLLWGHRRYFAAKIAQLKELHAIITDKLLSESEVRIIQFTENMHRADLSGSEKWQGAAELLRLNAGWQMKDLAEHLHLDPSSVTRLMSPSKCIPAAQEALRAGQIGISDCYALSKRPEADQAEMLALKLGGASAQALERTGRQRRAVGPPAVKLSRVKCLLSGGVCLVVTGDGITLDKLLDALAEAQREAKRARDQALDVKTFQAVLKDRAKKEEVSHE